MIRSLYGLKMVCLSKSCTHCKHYTEYAPDRSIFPLYLSFGFPSTVFSFIYIHILSSTPGYLFATSYSPPPLVNAPPEIYARS